MKKNHLNKVVYTVCLLSLGHLAGCATTKDQSISMNSNNIEIHQQTSEPTEVILSDAEVLVLFQKLQKKYKDDKSNSNYIHELNEFEKKYGHYWNATGLIRIERGRAYRLQAFEIKDSPSLAANTFKMSESEYRAGLNAMSKAKFEDKEAIYSTLEQLIDNANFCESRYHYLFFKIQSLKSDDNQKLSLLESYRVLFNDSSCPTYVRAWAVNQSISYNTDRDKFKRRVDEAYRYIERSKNTEEIIYINSTLAWAEFSLGNYSKSLELYDQFDNKKIKMNEKYVYNSEGLISRIEYYKKSVKAALETRNCRQYWNSDLSSKRSEKSIIEIINSYNELHDLANKGRRETTPVYETLSYSKERIVVDYNVSPLLFKVQSAAERLIAKIKKLSTAEYQVFYSNMIDSVGFLQKSVDYRVKGYYLKKKDYRGEWEKADAYIDESRSLYSEALKSAVEKTTGRKYSECIIDDWNRYIKAVSDMSM